LNDKTLPQFSQLLPPSPFGLGGRELAFSVPAAAKVLAAVLYPLPYDELFLPSPLQVVGKSAQGYQRSLTACTHAPPSPLLSPLKVEMNLFFVVLSTMIGA